MTLFLKRDFVRIIGPTIHRPERRPLLLQPSPGALPNPMVIAACLDGIVHALSDRPGLPEAQRLASARAAMTLILSFFPRDAIQLMLAGQAVLFNALAADGARDLLRGMADTLKPRAQSNVINMARVTQKHLETLIRLQARATRADTAELVPTAQANPAPASATKTEPATTTEPPTWPEPSAEAATRTATPITKPPEPVSTISPATTTPVTGTPAPIAPVTGIPETSAQATNAEPSGGRTHPPRHAADPSGGAGTPADDGSWLDDPIQQWLVETPAEIALREAAGATQHTAWIRGTPGPCHAANSPAQYIQRQANRPARSNEAHPGTEQLIQQPRRPEQPQHDPRDADAQYQPNDCNSTNGHMPRYTSVIETSGGAVPFM